MKKLSLLFILGLAATAVQAAENCCQGPLFRNFNIMINGGVAPAILADRGHLLVTTTACVDSVNELNCTKDRKFGQEFKQPPFNIGVQIGWSACCNVELFGEFNYRRAKGRCNSQAITLPVNISSTFRTNTNHFQAFGGFLGARYYFNRWACDSLAFFFGLKVGAVHHRKVQTNPFAFTIPTTTGTEISLTPACVEWYRSNTTVAGGGQIGFDWLFGACQNFSLFFNAEVLAEAALKPRVNIPLGTSIQALGYSNWIRGCSGTLVSFPINLGLRWWFC